MSPTTSPKLTLRRATVADIPRLMEIAQAAYAEEDGISRGMWPERLEPDPVKREAAIHAWHTEAHTKGIQEEKERLWICVEIDEGGGEKEIAGWATWHIIEADDKGNLEDGQVVGGEEEKLKPSQPKGLDVEFLGRMRRLHDEAVDKALGKDATVGMYTFRPIITDPKHQRKGVGRMIVDWGIARAAAEGKDIYLGSSEAGCKLYTAAGFQKVGECPIEGVEQHLMVWRAPRTGR